MNRSVQPEWCRELSIQQQSVLFLAARGPDGIAKAHPCKDVVRAYRGTVLVAARYGVSLDYGQDSIGDDFMDLSKMADDVVWAEVVREFFRHHDELPHHYLMHLLHGAQILGYKHPDERIAQRWRAFYLDMVRDLHLFPESEAAMDARLSDWGRKEWVEMIPAPLPAESADLLKAQMIDPPLEEVRREVERLTDELHRMRLHPDYEYVTTECGRKAATDLIYPQNRDLGEGWEENIIGGEPHSSWERFEYTEEYYWRRRKQPESTSRDSVGGVGLSENLVVAPDGFLH
jgi:hypothetical protein